MHLLLERLAITVLGLAFVGLSLAGGLLLLGSLSRGAFFVTRGLAAPFWLLLLLLLLHIFAIGALLAGAACARAVLTSFLVRLAVCLRLGTLLLSLNLLLRGQVLLIVTILLAVLLHCLLALLLACLIRWVSSCSSAAATGECSCGPPCAYCLSNTYI